MRELHPGCARTDDIASASSAITPPSPLLLARMMSTTYFSDTTIIRDQKIAEMPPMTVSALMGIPCAGLKVSFTA